LGGNPRLGARVGTVTRDAARVTVRRMSSRRNFRIGVDENGLGPRLGPMLVTAVMARVTEEGAAVIERKPRGGLAKRLGDSKAMVAYGDVALAEAWARALAARGNGRAGFSYGTVDELVHAIAFEDRAKLRAPCPDHVAAQCWNTNEEKFVATDDLVETIGEDLDKLAGKGVQIVAVRSSIVCAKRLNDGLDAGRSRFTMDLHAMEELILSLQTMANEEVEAICGKVGGFGKYSGAFGPLGGRMHAILQETRPKSVYRFPGLGDIAFVQDGDATDLLVSLASMVGKWMREALMERIVRHYQAMVPDLAGASGYHDPVTTRFVAATQLVRKEKRVPVDCFERRGKG
jgi:ribonuclease HII